METVSSLIDRLNARKSETAADIRQRETDITATEDAMAEALSNRNSEYEDFKATIRDGINAVEPMASAIYALTASSNNKLSVGNIIQKRTAHGKGVSEFSVDPEKAPEAFAAPCGGRSSEGGGITSITGYFKEYLEDEIKTTKAAEAPAQKKFKEQRAAPPSAPSPCARA